MTVLLDHIVASPSSGDEGIGKTIALTLELSGPVTVTGTPTLSLNDGGTATYIGGSGTNALTFGYTVAASNSSVPSLAITQVNLPNGATVKDAAGNAAILSPAVGTVLGLQIDTTPPVVTKVVASPSSGDAGIGKTISLTLAMSEVVMVTGTPTLTLNDGGTATYAGGSGTNVLTFSYTVGASDSSVSALAVTQVNLPNGGTVQDMAGNTANLSGAAATSGPQIDTTTPVVTKVLASPSSGDEGIGKTIDFTVDLSKAVMIRGTPTLTLNNGGIATYTGGYASTSALATTIANFTGGSDINVLTFSYTVGASDGSTSALAITQVNLPNGATVQDAARNGANLSGALTTLTGLQIDTTTPAVTKVVASPASGTEVPGNTITLTLNLSEAVTVTGAPTLTLNDGGTATYTGGSGTNALTFSYTVGASDSPVSALAIMQVNLPNGATVQNAAGNTGNLSGALTTLTGLVVDAPPVVTKVVASPSIGDEGVGKTIVLTLTMNEAVTVTGTPTLTLNDGGMAIYTGGSGTNALTFSYTVGAGDSSTLALAITQANLLNGATVKDAAGTAANLSGALTALPGLQIDTATPAVTMVVASPASGIEGIGKTINLTLDMSEAVTVTGTPTLTLNDGGIATYTGGSGTNALTFSYTVGASDSSTSALAITQANLPGGTTVRDAAGNAANLSGAATILSGLQIGTTIPSVTQVLASPASGTEVPGNTIALTLDMSEVVTVTGTPTLTLNDGGTATYTGGSGTNALTFSYTVGANDSPVSALAITQANLPNGATVKDTAGNAANLSGALTTLTGLAIDPPPAVTKVVASPSSGDEGIGKTIVLTLTMNEAVTVAGTPTLTLNDGGTATYSGGSGTNALTFSYTVGAGDSSTSALAITQANLPNGATVKDAAGVAANLSGALTTLTGLQIDTTTPAVTMVVASPASGTEVPGNTVALTLDMSKAVTVTGTPTLTLNDGGIATYTGGSGTNALSFSYTVGTADSAVSALAITQANLPSGATVRDAAGNAANLSGAVTTLSGLAINPSVSSGYNDGAVNAPAGTPQLPSLLSGYAVRPPWKVAGIDYAVGVPSGTALKDPLTLSMSGVSVDTTSHTIFVTGNNVTLNGYDFSLEGGWEVYVEGANDVIENSNFKVGANNLVPIGSSTAASNLTVMYNTIDGGGAGVAGNPTAIYTLISFGGSGGMTAEYNWLKNAPQHIIEFLNGTLIDRYNLIQDAGYYVGAHVNDVQFNGSVSNGSVIDFNTVYNPQPVNGYPDAQGEGIQVEAQLGSTITNTQVENNTVIATGPSLTVSYPLVVRQDSGNVINGAIVQANYLDTTGAYGPFYPPSGSNLTYTNNVNMVTGAQYASPSGTTPSDVTNVLASPASGTVMPGATVTLTLDLAEVVTVTGTPTLALNTGGIATYTGGSGTNALTFSYTVSILDAIVPALAITQVNLPNGATVHDAAGNAANLAGALTTLTGLAIDPPYTMPTATQVTASPSSGVEGVGNNITLTIGLNEAVTVSGGTPSLALNDGGTATYDATATAALHDPMKLLFDYTIGASDLNTPALGITGVDLNGAAIQDAAGNNANLADAATTLSGLQIDTTTPTVTQVAASPSSGIEHVGDKITLTLGMNEAVTVSGGTPALTLNDGGTATYDQAATSALNNPTNQLVFDYTVAASDTSTSALAVTSVSLNGATIEDVAGNHANLSGAAITLAGLQVDAASMSVGLLTQFIAAASNIGGSNGSGAIAPPSLAQQETQFLAGNSHS